MEFKPHKIKCEILFFPSEKATVIKTASFFVCDPKKNTKCDKVGCGEKCTMTGNIRYAKEFDIFEKEEIEK